MSLTSAWNIWEKILSVIIKFFLHTYANMFHFWRGIRICFFFCLPQSFLFYNWEKNNNKKYAEQLNNMGTNTLFIIIFFSFSVSLLLLSSYTFLYDIFMRSSKVKYTLLHFKSKMVHFVISKKVVMLVT